MTRRTKGPTKRKAVPLRKPGAAPARARKSPQRRGRQAGRLFEDLVALQARLRAPNGCPWDREQTHQSLRTYLVEEAYEVLDALDSGDDRKFLAELGDLLLQIVFHAQLAGEEGRFTIADVVEAIHRKMVRRHPHVFGKVRARNSADVLKNWEQLKTEERQQERAAGNPGGEESVPRETSLLDGVPRSLPAVLEAFQLTRRAARIGFDWDHTGDVLDKLAEEAAELRQALGKASRQKAEEELGDLLFAAVNVARSMGADPEIALKTANAKFKARFRDMERRAAASGRRLADVPRDEMEALWDAAKRTSGEGVAR